MTEYKTVVYDDKTFTFLRFVSVKMLEEAPDIEEEPIKLRAEHPMDNRSAVYFI